MRSRILFAAVGATLMVAVPALAQSVIMPMGPGGGTNARQYSQEDRSLPLAYRKGITALSYKTLQQRAEDGGTLTPEHVASLQRELDALTHKYRIATDLRIKPS